MRRRPARNGCVSAKCRLLAAGSTCPRPAVHRKEDEHITIMTAVNSARSGICPMDPKQMFEPQLTWREGPLTKAGCTTDGVRTRAINWWADLKSAALPWKSTTRPQWLNRYLHIRIATQNYYIAITQTFNPATPQGSPQKLGSFLPLRKSYIPQNPFMFQFLCNKPRPSLTSHTDATTQCQGVCSALNASGSLSLRATIAIGSTESHLPDSESIKIIPSMGFAISRLRFRSYRIYISAEMIVGNKRYQCLLSPPESLVNPGAFLALPMHTVLFFTVSVFCTYRFSSETGWMEAPKQHRPYKIPTRSQTPPKK